MSRMSANSSPASFQAPHPRAKKMASAGVLPLRAGIRDSGLKAQTTRRLQAPAALQSGRGKNRIVECIRERRGSCPSLADSRRQGHPSGDMRTQRPLRAALTNRPSHHSSLLRTQGQRERQEGDGWRRRQLDKESLTNPASLTNQGIPLGCSLSLLHVLFIVRPRSPANSSQSPRRPPLAQNLPARRCAPGWSRASHNASSRL